MGKFALGGIAVLGWGAEKVCMEGGYLERLYGIDVGFSRVYA